MKVPLQTGLMDTGFNRLKGNLLPKGGITLAMTQGGKAR